MIEKMYLKREQPIRTVLFQLTKSNTILLMAMYRTIANMVSY